MPKLDITVLIRNCLEFPVKLALQWASGFPGSCPRIYIWINPDIAGELTWLENFIQGKTTGGKVSLRTPTECSAIHDMLKDFHHQESNIPILREHFYKKDDFHIHYRARISKPLPFELSSNSVNVYLSPLQFPGISEMSEYVANHPCLPTGSVHYLIISVIANGEYVREIGLGEYRKLVAELRAVQLYWKHFGRIRFNDCSTVSQMEYDELISVKTDIEAIGIDFVGPDWSIDKAVSLPICQRDDPCTNQLEG
jgi:hypothetical protein